MKKNKECKLIYEYIPNGFSCVGYFVLFLISLGVSASLYPEVFNTANDLNSLVDIIVYLAFLLICLLTLSLGYSLFKSLNEYEKYKFDKIKPTKTLFFNGTLKEIVEIIQPKEHIQKQKYKTIYKIK